MPLRRFNHCPMSKKAVNLSVHEKVLQEAEEVMNLRGISNLTVLVEELIRAEYEKRFGLVIAKTLTSETSALADKIEDAALSEIEQRSAPAQPPATPSHGDPTPRPTPPTPHGKARSSKSTGVPSPRK